jgi:ATP/maltotriose-dependent transcriptional regulator MalT
LADGWAVGLILILQSLRQGIVPEKVDDATREGNHPIFWKEIFDRISPEMKDFLLRTAFLPQ